MALKWFGPAVTARLERAQIAGVNRTMGAAVQHAKNNHAWQNRSATLEGSIDIVEYARSEGRAVRGVWGSQDVVYALIHELGGEIRPKRARRLRFVVQGRVVYARKVTIPSRPYLRPAAATAYPALAANIRAAFEASS